MFFSPLVYLGRWLCRSGVASGPNLAHGPIVWIGLFHNETWMQNCASIYETKKKIIQKYHLGESLWISAAWISRDSQRPTGLYVSHTDNSCGCCSKHGSVRGRVPSSSPAWAAGDSRFVFDPPLYKLHVSYGCLGILLPHRTLCSGWSFVCPSSKSQVSHCTITSSSRGAWPTS